MSDKPHKRDSTGEIFRVRQRGGKNAKKQKERAERVEEGSFVPQVWWSASSGRALSSGSGLPVVEDKKRKTPPPEAPEELPDSPPKAAAEVSAAAEGGHHSAASSGSGSLGVGSGFSSGSSAVPPIPCDPKVGSKRSSVPRALETSFRVVSDYHGVLDRDTGNSFSRSAQQVIRLFLRQSVFHQFLILSYIGTHGRESANRRARLKREADELRSSLPPDQACKVRCSHCESENR